MEDRFEFRGVNHIALVCRDMAETVRFYRDVLGMKLIKTIELPEGMGQHFFFDIGNGDSLAFFWFRDAAAGQPGKTAPKALPGVGDIVTAHGSMNHLAFNVPAEKFDAYVALLKEKGIATSPVINHDNSLMGVSAKLTDDVFVRSVYFFDPDGVCLEFACWTKTFGPKDVAHAPRRADGTQDESVIDLSHLAPA